MALHRDIYWIGRQWAVTGFGMQAVNQKHGGEFDIAIENLWDDDPRIVLRGQKWFNPDDFAKGLAVAQARFPRPLNNPAPAPLPVERLLQASAPAAPPPAILPAAAPIELPAVEDVPTVAVEAAPEPAQPKEPAPSFTHMSVLGQAKLSRVWRAQRRR
jgi:hypothetical protein